MANHEATGNRVQAETYLNALTTQAIMDMFVVSLSDGEFTGQAT